MCGEALAPSIYSREHQTERIIGVRILVWNLLSSQGRRQPGRTPERVCSDGVDMEETVTCVSQDQLRIFPNSVLESKKGKLNCKLTTASLKTQDHARDASHAAWE